MFKFSAIVFKAGNSDSDMGLIPKTKVKMLKRAPMGDPLDIVLRGYELTLRIEDAKNIDKDF